MRTAVLLIWRLWPGVKAAMRGHWFIPPAKAPRVNAVAPGLILGTSFHNTHTTKKSAQKTISGIPILRAGNADDVARAVLYLASEYDGFITGATLDINGGVYNM